MAHGFSPTAFFRSASTSHQIVGTRPLATGDKNKPATPRIPPYSREKRAISRTRQTGIRTLHLVGLVYDACTTDYEGKALSLFNQIQRKPSLGVLREKNRALRIHKRFAAGWGPLKA